MAAPDETNLHASALVLGERGLIILGPSGAGKSSLALTLISQARARGLFARLISDDRVLVKAQGGRVVARAHPTILGTIEVRGAGILPLEACRAAILGGVIRLQDNPPRMPGENETYAVAGVALPCLTLRQDLDLPAKSGVVEAWLARDLQTGSD